MRRIFLDSLLLLCIFLESLVSGNKTDILTESDVDHLRPKAKYYDYGPLWCDRSSDCAETHFCYSGICIVLPICGTFFPPCPSGFHCHDGKCTASVPLTPSIKVPKAVGDTCSQSSECRPGLICEFQRCKKQVFEGHVCYTDEECLGDLQCLNNLCKRTIPLNGVCISNIQCAAQTVNSECRYRWNEYRHESIGECRCREGFLEEYTMGTSYCSKININARSLLILIGTPLFFLTFAIVSCYLKHPSERREHTGHSHSNLATPVTTVSHNRHTSFIRGIPLDELPPAYEDADKYSVPLSSLTETPPPNYYKAQFVFPTRTNSKKKLRNVKSAI